jgi:hypothetical protein
MEQLISVQILRHLKTIEIKSISILSEECCGLVHIKASEVGREHGVS